MKKILFVFAMVVAFGLVLPKANAAVLKTDKTATTIVADMNDNLSVEKEDTKKKSAEAKTTKAKAKGCSGEKAEASSGCCSGAKAKAKSADCADKEKSTANLKK